MQDPVLEYTILDALDAPKGRVTQRQISQRLGRSLASVNFAVRMLAIKGYIKIRGANKRNLRYQVTPAGVLQKAVLAYRFMVRQRVLYDEVRKGLLNKLRALSDEKVKEVAIVGWTPFTESVILFLISEGIMVKAVYVNEFPGVSHCNRIPLKTIGEFSNDCQALVLLEPLPPGVESGPGTRVVVCFPGSGQDDAGNQEDPLAQE